MAHLGYRLASHRTTDIGYKKNRQTGKRQRIKIKKKCDQCKKILPLGDIHASVRLKRTTRRGNEAFWSKIMHPECAGDYIRTEHNKWESKVATLPVGGKARIHLEEDIKIERKRVLSAASTNYTRMKKAYKDREMDKYNHYLNKLKNYIRQLMSFKDSEGNPVPFPNYQKRWDKDRENLYND